MADREFLIVQAPISNPDDLPATVYALAAELQADGGDLSRARWRARPPDRHGIVVVVALVLRT